MPTLHIAAQAGEIAPAVILPGDPNRARRIAEAVLDDARLVTDVRGVLGFTGTHAGTPLTVMASGMGMPSATIYATELFSGFDVQRIVRVGTAGGIAPSVRVGDTVIATGAHTDSNMNERRIPGIHFAAISSFGLVAAAHRAAGGADGVHVGPVVSRDHFYLSGGEPELALLAQYSVLAVEMEAAAILAVAAEFGREALAVLTISDHLLDHSSDMTAAERETRFSGALDLALAAAVS